MSAAYFAALPTASELIRSPLCWALAVSMLGLWLLLPTRVRFGKPLGALFIAIAGGLFASDLPRVGSWPDQGVFWLLATIALGAAVCTIASRSPVYSAIWFALSLLGTAGLFLFQGAQFLGVATVVVYAGAIVVTFLFVIMLAQPQGNSPHDRLSWGGLPKVLGVVTAGALVGILMVMMGRFTQEEPGLEDTASEHTALDRQASGGVLDEKHVANLGRRLFSEHLVSIEVAGTMLLVALVGAVAIAIQGKQRLGDRIEEALR